MQLFPRREALPRYSTRLLFGALLTFLSLQPLFAANDWPQWRGPDRTGVSRETGLMRQWPENGPRRIWEIDGLGQGDGSPSTSGPYLLIQGARGEDSLLFARDRQTGEALWEIRLDRKFVNANNPGPSATPTIEGERVYALSGNGTLICANIEDGSMIWQVSMTADLGGRVNRWAYAESPLIEGGKLIVAPGGRGGTVAALNKTTGETIWRSRGLKDNNSYASAIAADVGPVRAIVHFTAAAGVGLDAETGNLLWRYTPPANRTANASTPVFHNNKVFYTSDYGNGGGLLELAPVNRRILTREVYFNKVMKNHFGGVVLIDGYLYGASGNILTCMDFDTGKAVWQNRGLGKSALTAADGRLYLLSNRGTVGLVAATPEGYALHGRFDLQNVNSPTRTAPIVSDGRMYVRNGGRLACYDVRARTE